MAFQKHWSHNGTYLTSSEFKAFARKWDFQRVISSPHFSQANRKAERAVKAAKDIMQQDNVFLALLLHRSIPIQALGASPAELASGRELQTTLVRLQSIASGAVYKNSSKNREKVSVCFEKCFQCENACFLHFFFMSRLKMHARCVSWARV